MTLPTGQLSRWRSPIRFGAIVIGLLVWLAFDRAFSDAGDAHAYFSADPANLYAGHQGDNDAYLYSPAFAQAIEPLRWFGWDLFRTIWRAIEVAALAVLTGPFVGLLLFFAPVQTEIRLGNINVLLGLAVAAGFRWPATWAFVLLTKVTPGVGLLWFAVRREWRNLVIALGATGAVAGLSFIYSPGLWGEWIASLAGQSDPTNGVQNLVTAPLAIRVVAAATLVAWGATTSRKWTVLVAAFLAMPTTAIWNASSLIALAYVLRPDRREPATLRQRRLSSRQIEAGAL